MSAQNDGRPAFPCQSFEYDAGIRVPVFEHGMTLRDWFAGQFIYFSAISAAHQQRNVTPDDIGRECYRYADGMLRHREANQ